MTIPKPIRSMKTVRNRTARDVFFMTGGEVYSVAPLPPVLKNTCLAVLFLTVFIDLIGFGMVIPFLSFYAREYGASGIAVGAVVGIYSIMQFFFAPIWGRMS